MICQRQRQQIVGSVCTHEDRFGDSVNSSEEDICQMVNSWKAEIELLAHDSEDQIMQTRELMMTTFQTTERTKNKKHRGK